MEKEARYSENAMRKNMLLVLQHAHIHVSKKKSNSRGSRIKFSCIHFPSSTGWQAHWKSNCRFTTQCGPFYFNCHLSYSYYLFLQGKNAYHQNCKLKLTWSLEPHISLLFNVFILNTAQCRPTQNLPKHICRSAHLDPVCPSQPSAQHWFVPAQPKQALLVTPTLASQKMHETTAEE